MQYSVNPEGTEGLLESTRGDWENSGVERLTFDDLIVAQCDARPEAIALVHGTQVIRYGELHKASSYLADSLIQQGAEPESVVGVYGRRTVEFAGALVGVLKSGASYLPVDSTYPDLLIEFMLRDANTRIVLCTDPNNCLIRRFPILFAHSFCAHEFSSPGSFSVRKSLATPENAAAIIYTSGSESAPKGVILPHRSLVTRARIMARFPRPEVVCHVAPLSAVGHIADLLIPLAMGSRVFVVGEESVRSLTHFAEAIRISGVKQISLVPSHLRAMLHDDYCVSCLSRLDRIIVTGEGISQTLCESSHHHLPRTSLINAYGLTESAGVASFANISPTSALTIGNGNSHMRIAIVDENLEETSPDEAGRLLLSGPQIGRGYVGRPQDSNNHFVSLGSGSRDHAFLSGDVGRRLADGRINLLGRADAEVNIRGIRANLLGIEHEIEREQDIDRAVVTIDTREERSLLHLYCVPSPGAPLDSKDLRWRLSLRLPPRLMPATITIVDSVPLLLNGKIDRTAIRSTTSAEFRRQPQENRTKSCLENQLLTICCEIFGTNDLTVTDDFIAVGDSLAFMEVISRLQADYGVELTFDEIIDAKNVSGLARSLTTLKTQ